MIIPCGEVRLLGEYVVTWVIVWLAWTSKHELHTWVRFVYLLRVKLFSLIDLINKEDRKWQSVFSLAQDWSLVHVSSAARYVTAARLPSLITEKRLCRQIEWWQFSCVLGLVTPEAMLKKMFVVLATSVCLWIGRALSSTKKCCSYKHVWVLTGVGRGCCFLGTLWSSGHIKVELRDFSVCERWQ